MHIGVEKNNMMNLKNLKEKKIHFIGIGGIGMSGLAELLVQKGYDVSGSDLSKNDNTFRLEKEGVTIFTGHDPHTLSGKDIIVRSTDIKEDNPELREARLLGVPILHRSEMLALLMQEHQGIAISGTHGKTTTTALTGWVFEKSGLDPTIINGGIMNAWKSNVKIGKGQWCIAEADESDRSFLKLPRKIAVVTNIDLEHMDHYGSFEKLYEAFEIFTTHLPADGLAVLGIDNPQVYALWKRIKEEQKCATFGVHPEADIRAENIRVTSKGSRFDLIQKNRRLKMSLSLYGHHNVLNALSVAVVAFECGIKEEQMCKALTSFKGVQRRFTQVGEWGGITIIDDYAHHPIEIKATLKAAKDVTQGRIIAVIEPHRYSRLMDLFQDFASCSEGAEITIVLPVYAARETPKEGITHQKLVEAMKGEVHCCNTAEELPFLIKSLGRKGDMVICLGAGSISSLARKLPMQLNKKALQSTA
ncbi:MAG TPA: UDP-N-acetylmuramate--L-alanine ligase [Holosporales bacterium]|nr:UDP-N-acetylmuramate--L-alanine ligase [Holosporales bacterium]